MQEFQEWFMGAKAAAKESSDRTGDSKALEAKLQDLQVLNWNQSPPSLRLHSSDF
jgi:hypothetical protein